MRQILAGSVLAFAVIATPAIAQDPAPVPERTPMQPAAIPDVQELRPVEAPLPDFRNVRNEDVERCVADFALPYMCCADNATMGATTEDHRIVLDAARRRFCVNDEGIYPAGIGPDGNRIAGTGVVPDTPVEPVETESDAFGSSERPH